MSANEELEPDSEELDRISGPANLPFAIKLAAWSALLSVGVFFTSSAHWESIALGVAMTGFAFAYGFELLHQVAHGTAFTDPRASRAAGILLGLPMLVSLAAYHALHSIHHALVGTDRNLEYSPDPKAGAAWHRLTAFFMLPHYRAVLTRMLRLLIGRPVLDEVHPATQRHVRQEYALLVLVLLLSAAAAFVVPGFASLLFWFWALPLVAVAAPLHSIIEYAEHYAVEATPDITRNTRTVRTWRLVEWAINYNNLHCEHHLYALVRPEQLHRIHAKVQPRLKFVSPGYLDFFRLEVIGHRNPKEACT